MSTATLSLTPWAAEALSLDEEHEIAVRLVGIHARAYVGKSRRGWTIRVTSWALLPTYDPVYRLDRHHMHGHLADLVNDAIDAYERKYVFTPEELAQIQRQSAA